MNQPFHDADSAIDRDHDTWLDTREAMIARLTDWIDTVGESESGRRRIAAMIPRFEGSQQVDGFTDESSVHETLMGLSKITHELTALRHDLKSNVKQGRSLAESLAADAQRIVSASSSALDQISQLQSSGMSQRPSPDQALDTGDQMRSMTNVVIEADEAMLRLREAFVAVAAAVDRPPAVPLVGWFSRDAVGRHHDAWSTVWRSLDETIRGLADGLRMSVDRMSGQLDAIGLRRIGTVGEMLDPHLMQVLEVQAQADQPPGTVLRILRFGYQQNDRVIRPAQVSVAGGP